MIRWDQWSVGEWALIGDDDGLVGTVNPADEFSPAMFFPRIGGPCLTLELARAIADKLEELEKESASRTP